MSYEITSNQQRRFFQILGNPFSNDFKENLIQGFPFCLSPRSLRASLLKINFKVAEILNYVPMRFAQTTALSLDASSLAKSAKKLGIQRIPRAKRIQNTYLLLSLKTNMGTKKCKAKRLYLRVFVLVQNILQARRQIAVRQFEK